MNYCACGCGDPITDGKQYARGHNRKGQGHNYHPLTGQLRQRVADEKFARLQEALESGSLVIRQATPSELKAMQERREAIRQNPSLVESPYVIPDARSEA